MMYCGPKRLDFEGGREIPFVGPWSEGPTSWPLSLRVGPFTQKAKLEIGKIPIPRDLEDSSFLSRGL